MQPLRWRIFLFIILIMLNYFNATVKRIKTPIILQNENAECGLTSLAMVFHHYNLKIDLISLREIFPVSQRGMTAADLKRVAAYFNFDTKVLRVELEQLNTLVLPCILHWDFNHFVVLVKQKNEQLIIHDPARGRIKLALSEVSSHFTGVALEFFPNSHFQPKDSEKKIRLAEVLRNFPLKKFFKRIILLTVFLQAFAIIMPLYVQKMVDGIKFQWQTSDFVFLAGTFIGFKLIEAGVLFFRSFVIERFNNSLNLHLGLRIFRHLLKLPAAFFEKRSSGDLISRFGSVEKINQLLSRNLIDGFVDSFICCALLVVIVFYNFDMALLVILSCLLYTLIKFIKVAAAKRHQDGLLKFSAVQNSYFIETLRGINPIKIFLKEKLRYQHWRSKYIDYLNSNVNYLSHENFFAVLKNGLLGTELILVILLGSLQVLNHHITLGMLYAFLFYRSQLVSAFTNFIDSLTNYEMLKLHLLRLGDISSQLPEAAGKKSQKNPSTLGAIKQLRVENLGYSHTPLEPFIFQNLHFEIAKGESLAIIAPSGFGKTTLLKLLMGLLTPTEGAIFINNIELKTIDLAIYRQKIAAVMQEDQLFAGNIYENVSFFATAIDIQQVIHCCKLAGIHQEIRQMPMQYDTLIAEMGTSLSGGQKQRILLARALYKQPELLFLDEASSHLDLAKEAEINANLRASKIMRIIAAHRPETIRSADSVINLQAIAKNRAGLYRVF